VSKKQFFTTGEVAELLQISKSTVSRKFDRGIFLGRKNSITNERSITRASLEDFMRRYGMSLDALEENPKNLLLLSDDTALQRAVQNAVADDESIELKHARFGSDTIYSCSKLAPDLLILDEKISDMPCSELAKALRRMPELSNLKILCYSRKRKQRDCAQKRCEVDGHLSDNVGSESYLKQQINVILGSPEEVSLPPATFQPDRRQWPRHKIGFPLEIEVYCTDTPRLRNHGTAVLEDISHGGARVANIQLRGGSIPWTPFHFLLKAHQVPLENWRADCRVIRLRSNGSLTAGLQFHKITKPNLKKIELLLAE
jgi:two-component system chemotaxis response regulator CheY